MILKRIKITFLENSHSEEKILVCLLWHNDEERPANYKEFYIISQETSFYCYKYCLTDKQAIFYDEKGEVAKAFDLNNVEFIDSILSAAQFEFPKSTLNKMWDENLQNRFKLINLIKEYLKHNGNNPTQPIRQ